MANRPFPSYLIYVDKAGQYRWRYEAANHKTIADSGEGYTTYRACKHGIELMQQSYNSEVWRTDEAAKGDS